MPKPELVLSNTTTFFGGRIETVFQKAKKYGFKYLEILPYRWIKVDQILDLEKRYDIQVIGIHLPPAISKIFLEKILDIIWRIYLGSPKNNPELKLAEFFKTQNRNFYLLIHADLIPKLSNFESMARYLPLAIENVSYHPELAPESWNPLHILKRYPALDHVFDGGHFATIPQKYRPDLLETYAKLKPKIVHISYSNGFFHTLPNKKEQEELRQMLKLHRPHYIVLETNPLVHIQKGKEILEKIISTPS